MWFTAPLLDGTDIEQASAMGGSSGHTVYTICPPKAGTLGLEPSSAHRRGMYFYSCLVAQIVKNPPALQETWVQSLGWEDPLEKEMATHSSIPVWRIPRTEEPGELQSMRSQRAGHD